MGGLLLKRVAGTIATAVVALAATASASQAHSGSEVIRAACGSGYSVVSDGSRALKTSDGRTWGYIYLTYNRSTGINCLVTHKTAYHGTPTRTLVRLAVEGVATYQDWANYSHYAVIKASARGRCVAYWGDIANSDRSNHAAGGRWSYGNCG
jgi:hypothetical protein